MEIDGRGGSPACLFSHQRSTGQCSAVQDAMDSEHRYLALNSSLFFCFPIDDQNMFALAESFHIPSWGARKRNRIISAGRQKL
jgi:hypothetical protein